MDAKQKAEVLSQQFNSVFGEGKSYTIEEFNRKCNMTPGTYTKLEDINITSSGVKKLLQSQNPHKACGPDGISPRILKELAEEIAPILTNIYKSSISTGEVPSDWKSALVTPIFKKGEHYLPANYRPVSLTSVPCKILEHIVVSSLMEHLEKNTILCPQQHGFRKGKSCETQLLELTMELFDNTEEGKQTDMIVLDFSKAFDKVNHSLLIHKLHHYGVTRSGRLSNWIKNFLSDRRQAVVVEGSISEPCSVRSGVPQGSVLGPSLFLVYINDLPEQITSQARLFADDTAAYRIRASATDIDHLQEDLRRLEIWEDSWEMSFHPDKCTTLPVTRKTTPFTSEYHLHGQILKTVESAKYLGVTIQKNLSWDKHINNVCVKANKTLGFLRRNLKISAIKLKETAYKTYVRPILEYAATVWNPFSAKHIDRLEAVQRRAARFVVNRYHNRSSVSEMIDRLQWPSLQQRRKSSRLIMLYKIINDYIKINTPSIKPAPTRQRRGNQHQLCQLRCRTSYRQHSFLPETIRDWNELPEDVAGAATLDTFMSRVG